MTNDTNDQSLPNDDPQESASAPAAPAASEPAPPAPEQPKTRLRDRAFGLRSLIAVGVAALLLGGAGGAAIGVATGGGDDVRREPGRMQFRDGDGRPPHGGPGMPQDGGVPPTTAPDDGTQPDSSGDSSESGASGT